MIFRIDQLILGVALSAIGSLACTSSASAQFPFDEFELNAPERVAQAPASETIEAEPPRLVDSVPSSSDLKVSRSSVSDLRIARAQYRSQQRVERLERNRWMGYEPLRPNWNALPMMSSRYPYQSRIYVPVYYFGR